VKLRCKSGILVALRAPLAFPADHIVLGLRAGGRSSGRSSGKSSGKSSRKISGRGGGRSGRGDLGTRPDEHAIKTASGPFGTFVTDLIFGAKTAVMFLTYPLRLSKSLVPVAPTKLRSCPHITAPVNVKARGIFVLAATNLVEI